MGYPRDGGGVVRLATPDWPQKIGVDVIRDDIMCRLSVSRRAYQATGDRSTGAEIVGPAAAGSTYPFQIVARCGMQKP